MPRLILVMLVAVVAGSAFGWGYAGWRGAGMEELFRASDGQPMTASASMTEPRMPDDPAYGELSPAASGGDRSATEADTASVSDRGASASTGRDRSSEPIGRVEVMGGTVYDFGRMNRGETGQYTFRFVNVGGGPLRLEVLGSTCKCTIGTLEKEVLAPGEQTEIRLEWTSQNVLESFGQSARIRTSDPDQPEVKLTIQGSVIDAIVAVPSQLSVGDIRSTDEVERVVRIYSYHRRPLEIESLSWGTPATEDRVELSHEIRKVNLTDPPDYSDAYNVAEIRVRLKPGLPNGMLRGRVVVVTNQDEGIDRGFELFGAVVGPVRVVAGSRYDDQKNLMTLDGVRRDPEPQYKWFLAFRGVEDADSLTVTAENLRPEEGFQIEFGEPLQRGTQTMLPVTLKVTDPQAVSLWSGSSSKNFGRVVFLSNVVGAEEFPVSLRFIAE
jgi:hypothetical protein